MQYRFFARVAQILLSYTVPTQLCLLEQVFLTKIDRLWAVFIEFNILASGMVKTHKLSPRNNVLVFVQVLINVFSVFGCQWNYWGSLGPWLALSHELGHNLNFDHDNSM